MIPDEIRTSLRLLANPDIAQHSQRFFKTGSGEYGEGDRFLGIRVPVIRAQVKKYSFATLEDAKPLLTSQFHEERLFALLLLVALYSKGDESRRKAVYECYLTHTDFVNNWDLVDSSAHHIVGAHLMNRDRSVLYQLSASNSLWVRRIAIMSTFYFIKKGQFDDALNLSEKLLNDKEDLIHKAVGWMLREIGKREISVGKAFLEKFAPNMPRTMLRYAIEKFPESERQRYLKGKLGQ
jgi:3-methyladenine DNA glycosylase AlkD